MKIYTKIFDKKVKILGLLIVFLVFPIILTTPILNLPYNEQDIEKNQDDGNKDALKVNAPPDVSYFKYYKVITIDHNKVAGSVSYPNFPVLINITDSDLKSDVQVDGDDIAFSISDTWLNHEIELFDQAFSTTHAQLIAWVQIPSLSGITDTVVRMYYGNSTMSSRQNPSGVWESNYRGVWHLNEQSGGSNSILDSTSYSNDGTDVNNPQLGQYGQIYNSIGFTDASGQRIEVPDDSSLDISNELTVEAWINPNMDTKWMTIVSKMDGALGSGNVAYFDIYIAINDMGNYDIGLSNPSDIYDEWGSSVSISTGTWQHFVFTYQSSTSMGRIFVNGAFIEEHNFGIGTLGTNAMPFYIGINRGWTGEVFDGLIDEVRVSSIPRSSGWINTEYQNQNDPDSFYTIGSEQLTASIPPIAKYFTYYKIITIDHTKVIGTANHLNFPMLISLIDEDLKYHAQPDGDDIAFASGSNWLNHEIELFDQSYSSTHAQLVAWIRIPLLSTSTNTTITMYYGNSTMSSQQNPTGVWSNNYIAVWHMNQDPSSSNIIDSTSNGYDLTPIGFTSDSRINNGKVGTAISLDGVNDYFYINSINGPLNDLTFQTWFTPDTTIASGGSQMDFFSGNSITNNHPTMRFTTSGTVNVFLEVTSDTSEGSYGNKNTWPTGSWFQFSYVRSMSLVRAFHYVNATLDTTDSSSDNANPHITWDQFSIAASIDGSRIWGPGAISEFRIINIALSSDWIATEYNNQYNPSSFYSVGSEQLVFEEPSNIDYFNYYKIISIDHTKVNGTCSHLNFPLLISILDDDLKSDVQVDGDDIAFSLDGKWLDHQIEQFNQSYSGSHAQLIAWVRIPFLSTAFDTKITMYYGNLTMNSRQNPNDVWYSDYSGVWHLSEDPSGIPPQIKDSTIPTSDGSAYGTMTSFNQKEGKIGGSIDFDGLNDYISITNNPELQITGELTVQIWFKANAIQNDYLFNKMGSTSSSYGWDLSFDDNTPNDGWVTFRFFDGISITEVGYEPVSTGKWYHVVGVFKPNDYAKFFLNGTLADIITTGIAPSLFDPPIAVVLGRRSQGLTPYYNGIIDEARISNVARSDEWIFTEYSNQFDPASFYSIGSEQSLKPLIYVDAQINAIDLYSNLLPNITISLYQNTLLIERATTEINGSIILSDLIEGEYNFTATIHSEFSNVTLTVNSTSQGILLDQPFQIINLTCDVSSHFFELTDVDGSPLESGWILVGNDTHILKKCYIDPSGHTTFFWVNAPPSEYNYTVYYRNSFYDPSTLILASGDITTENATISIEVELTTVDFIVQTINAPITPVSGAKLRLTVGDPLGASIVNLTTDINGIATLRWLNSSGIGGDYCVQIEFFGVNRLFNETLGGPATVFNVSFTVVNKDTLEFRILIDLSQFQTELISLNPTDYVEIEWGSILKLRTLFNVSKVESGYESLLGPTYADTITYEMLLGGISVHSGSFIEEDENIGRHYIDIDTKELDSDISYVIIISAYKSGFSIPSDLILQLNVLEIEVELNQSNNDDSATSTYWSDNVDMTLNSYGQNSETLTIENALFQSVDHEFQFLISDVEHHWNLSKIVFNFYNITWNVGVSNINISITDPYGGFYVFNFTNHLGWDYAQGTWTGITLALNKGSLTNDNMFDFVINGTFYGSVDLVVDAYCIRDSISVQYSKFNVSDSISFLSKSEGWIISNITFSITDCYYISNWSSVDLSSLANLNLTTNEGFTYSLDVGYSNGSGSLTIDDRFINPVGNQFLFLIKSISEITFNSIIQVEYIQGFYINNVLETYNFTSTGHGITNGGTFQLNVVENSWEEQKSLLWFNGITDGISYFFPSDIDMNITIGSQTYSITDVSLGMGRFSLAGFTKNQILNALIETSLPINFSILLSIEYLREISYEIIGPLSYIIIEEPSVFGSVQYSSQLRYYSKTLDTSVLDADSYTVRFLISKEHYVSTTKDLNLFVLNRPTLLNESTEFFRKIEMIYVNDAVNFTLIYVDEIRGTKISSLKTQYYIWESYDEAGNVNATGQGSIYSTLENNYIVDFNTETRFVGEYLLIVILDKENYEYKNAMILLTIKKRDFNYVLSENLQDKQTNIVQGKSVLIELTVTDPTQGDIYVIDATIGLLISGRSYEFLYVENGTYTLNFQTNNINAFFTSKTLTGIIRISKKDYNPLEISVTIVVEMEELIPGIPTFYFLLIMSSVVALIGSIAGYKIYQNAIIPSFVKKVRAMKKSIKGDKSIAESLIYRDKEVFVGEIIKSDWNKLGLSLEEIFGITLEKSKKKKLSRKLISGITKEHDNKPLGLLLMKWDERIGTEIKIKYPSEISVSEKTLMQIYSTHEYSGEKGIITLTAEATNIISYYTGPEEGYYLLLILNLDDDPDVYEGGIADILRILLENIDEESYVRMIPSLFQRISLYPSLSYEEILAVTYQNKIKRTIINILRDEGVVIKSELVILLKDKYVHGFFDLDTILSELIKLEIIKVSSIKDVPSELIFLTNDIFMVRVPPLKLLDKPSSYGLPSQFVKDYRNDVKDAFQSYRSTDKDNIAIADLLSDPQIYETLRLLREAIVTRDDLAKLQSKGVDDIYGVLKLLWDNKVIKVFQDENKVEYYALLTDFYLDFIFPKYILKVIKSAYEQKSKVKKALIENLNILEDTYYKLKSMKKQ